MQDNSKVQDEELVLRYKAGDTDALDLLFSRNKALVTSVARPYFLIGGSFEDLIQEGMIGLHKAIVTYDETKHVKFNPFAKTCIKSAILDAVKIANRDKHRALNDCISLQDLDDLSIDISKSPEDMLISEEKRELLKEKIFSLLNQPQKKLLTYFLEGYSYNEIATLMNKDIKYVDNTLQIIKRKIRKNLYSDN